MRHQHGNDIYNFNVEIKADFSSNVAFMGTNDLLLQHLQTSISNATTSNYPDPEVRQLTRLLADFHNVNYENIIVTNGSAEAFYLLAHFFEKCKSTIFIPTFAEYEWACNVYKHNISFLPINQFDTAKCRTDLHWLCNPNNPDGVVFSPEKIEHFCNAHPNQYLIIDNAYKELSQDFESAVSLQKRYTNLISVHSLTKSFAIPAIRLGYIIANEDIISKIKILQPPWSVSTISQIAGIFVMKNYNKLMPQRELLFTNSKFLQSQISQIDGFEVIESNCNYFLATTKRITSAQLKSILIYEYGILIRDASNFRGLSPHHFRLSAQNDIDNRLIVNALKEVSAAQNKL